MVAIAEKRKTVIDKYALRRSILRDSFYEFVRFFWHEIIPETPVWNWHIKFVCDEMQRAAERVFRKEAKEHDYVINIPPGSTKSTICSVMFPAWVLTRAPWARIICASHTDTLVYHLSDLCRDIIRSDKFQRLYGEASGLPRKRRVEFREDANTKGLWKTQNGGWRLCATVGGKSPTGFHAHFLIVDDPIDPEKAKSDKEIKTACEWMDQTLQKRKVDSSISVTILVMQRLKEDDPSGHRFAKAKEAGPVRHICFPSEDSYPIKPAYCKKYYKEGLLDPKRIPRAVLRADFALMGEFGYSGQHGQQPVSPEGGMFKVGRFNRGKRPNWSEFAALCRFWDKAGTKKGGAYTVGVLMGRTHDDSYWVLDVVRDQWDSGEREQQIDLVTKNDGYDVVVGVEQEPGSGGKESAERTQLRLTKKGYRCEVIRSEEDKTVRANDFSIQVNQRNVWVPDGVDWYDDYKKELKYFWHGKYKDQVDASSGAFTVVSEILIEVGAL